MQNENIPDKNEALGLEIMRLKNCSDSFSEQDLLDALLNGREKTAESVSKLFRFARTHFETKARKRILEVCWMFLESALTKPELDKLKNDVPPRAGEPGFESIFDELADENLNDEYLQTLRTKR